MRELRMLGANIKKARQNQSLDSQEVANIMGFNLQDYNKIEKGINSISSHDLIKLSNILKVPVDTLLKPLPDDEYRALVLGITTKDLSRNLFDSLLDYIEDLVLTESSNQGRAFLGSQKESAYEYFKGELPF